MTYKCYMYSDAFAVSVMSLLYACKELDKLQTANHGQKIGVQAIQYALEVFFILLFNYVCDISKSSYCLSV